MTARGERKHCRWCGGGVAGDYVKLLDHEDNCVSGPTPASAPLRAPVGFRFDPFADVRQGKSLFQMQDEDWLVPDRGSE